MARYIRFKTPPYFRRFDGICYDGIRYWDETDQRDEYDAFTQTSIIDDPRRQDRIESPRLFALIRDDLND